MVTDWGQYYQQIPPGAIEPCAVLQDYAHLLPPQGRALDLACGRGGNALLLAQAGLHCEAWDLSAAALDQLQRQAQQHGLMIDCQQRDVLTLPPEPESFDVIVVSRFLSRELCPHIIAALRPGGLLYYQTFSRERPAHIRGPNNPDYLLAPGELYQLFSSLRLCAYREEGLLGDTSQGMRGEVWLVAQKNT